LAASLAALLTSRTIASRSIFGPPAAHSAKVGRGPRGGGSGGSAQLATNSRNKDADRAIALRQRRWINTTCLHDAALRPSRAT
jgi:hypothetical protein